MVFNCFSRLWIICLLLFHIYMSLQVHGGKGEQNLRQIHLGGSSQQVNTTPTPFLSPFPFFNLCFCLICSVVIAKTVKRDSFDFLEHVVILWYVMFNTNLHYFFAEGWFVYNLVYIFIFSYYRYGSFLKWVNEGIHILQTYVLFLK